MLKAARLFDGKSDALLPNRDGHRRGQSDQGRRRRDLTVPDGSTVIDLGDATLCPGFIDAHTHLTHERTADFNQGFVDGMRREVAEQAILSTVYARRTVEAGFTTVRDVGSGDLLDVGLRNSIAKGVVPGPRMLVCVHALGAIGGHADRNGLRHDLLPQRNEAEGIASGPDRLRAAVRYQVKYGADVIKFCASGGVLSLADEVDTPQLTLAEMTALCDEAHRLRKKVACHSHGDQAARDAVLAGVNSIEHGSFLSADTLKLMKERGTYLIPTLMAPDSLMPNLSKFPPEIAAKAVAANAALSKTFAEAVRLGVKVGFGTDSGVSKHGDNAREFVLMVKHGMTPAGRAQGRDLRRRRAARALEVDRHARARQARRPRGRPRRSFRRYRRDRTRRLRDEGRRGRRQQATLSTNWQPGLSRSLSSSGNSAGRLLRYRPTSASGVGGSVPWSRR